MDAPEPITLSAPAKVNLFLEVLGRRPDGYHDVDTVTLAVDLCDELIFRRSPDGDMSLTCDDPSLPCGLENLVIKAAHAVRAATGCRLGAAIELRKRIPTEAGLGGGSSDAATTIVGLNRLWALGLTRREMHGIAASLGSDLNLFLELPACRGSGRGERVRRIGPGLAPWLVIAKPPGGCPTGEVFRRLLVGGPRRSGDDAEAALTSGDFDRLATTVFNRLQPPAEEVRPELSSLLGRLGPHASVTGSGSACFALCRDRGEADELTARLASDAGPGERCWVVKGLTGEHASM